MILYSFNIVLMAVTSEFLLKQKQMHYIYCSKEMPVMLGSSGKRMGGFVGGFKFNSLWEQKCVLTIKKKSYSEYMGHESWLLEGKKIRYLILGWFCGKHERSPYP